MAGLPPSLWLGREQRENVCVSNDNLRFPKTKQKQKREREGGEMEGGRGREGEGGREGGREERREGGRERKRELLPFHPPPLVPPSPLCPGDQATAHYPQQPAQVC